MKMMKNTKHLWLINFLLLIIELDLDALQLQEERIGLFWYVLVSSCSSVED